MDKKLKYLAPEKYKELQTTNTLPCQQCCLLIQAFGIPFIFPFTHHTCPRDSVTLKDSFTNLEQSTLRFSVTMKLPGISLISPSTSPFQPENTAGFWHLFHRPLSTRRHDLEAWAPKDSNMTGHVLNDTKPDDDRANHGQYHEHEQYHDRHNDHHGNDHHHHHHHHHHHLLLLSTTTLNPFINSKSSHPTNRRHHHPFSKALTSMP